MTSTRVTAPAVAVPSAGTWRYAALLGGAGAVLAIGTALMIPAGLASGEPSAGGNVLDLAVFLLLGTGLAGFARSGAATGPPARIGHTVAFLGLGTYALAAALAFADPGAGEAIHPVSVPLTGLGMLVTGIATIRTGRWRGARRLAPLLCGVVPFAVELPGFIAFGDTPALNYFIAATWTAWLVLAVALWTAPADDRLAAELSR